MRAGKLDRVVTLQASTYGVDEAGKPLYTWADVAKVRAEILESSSVEFVRKYGVEDEDSRVFRIRYRDDVTNGNRIVFEGRNYNVKSVSEIQRRRGLELKTKAEA